MLYSKANVVNSLMDKIAAKCAIEPKPTHQHRADDLLDHHYAVDVAKHYEMEE